MSKYCSECGKQTLTKINTTLTKCDSCGFEYFDNPRPTCTIVVRYKNQILLGKRKKNPHKGSWGFIGGFVDNFETYTQAAIRETKEEAGIEICENQIEYIGVFSHDYEFQNQNLFILTNGYLVDINEEQKNSIVAGDDVEETKWIDYKELLELYLPFANCEVRDVLLKKIGFCEVTDLNQIRLLIDKVDEELLCILKKRFDLLEKIAKFKITNSLPVLDSKRWSEVIQSIKTKAINLDINPFFVEQIWQQIHTESRKIEQKIIDTQELPYK